mgnify:CR=1 FL=1
MNKFIRSWIFVLPVIAFLIGYMFWLFRAYYDVAYMDQIQIIAGNLNHMYNQDTTLQDFYYRTPFLGMPSIILFFINSKLFAYNTFLENIASGVILFLIALYFIRTNLRLFSGIMQVLFSFIVALVVFSLAKWEMSLWGGGYVHYVMILFGFICIDLAHKYYLKTDINKRRNNYFIPIYVVLSVIAILETTAYYFPFLFSLILMLILNYFLFKEKINLKRWKSVMVASLALLIFSFAINYIAERYSINHPYEPYGKVNLSHNLGEAINKVVTAPLFVIKFYLIANAGLLIDKDSYSASSFAHSIMPYIGFLILVFYSLAIYVYVKKRKLEGAPFINLIIYTIILYGTILAGRLAFNDVSYGASSRYSAATFAGLLGFCTFSLLFLNHYKSLGKTQIILYSLPVILIGICIMITNKNQWQIAPYRKAFYLNMAANLKANQNLETLMGYNNEITHIAREMMIRNKLNVFKPEIKLENYSITSLLDGQVLSGFYDIEKAEAGSYRWTNGKGNVNLPNLYTTKDTIKVQLHCYVPQSDTPIVVLNDKLLPIKTTAVAGGYEYTYAFQEQKVLFKAAIVNNSFVPQEVNKESPDTRKLGLIFNSLTLKN